jgi:hypothetical protein
LVVAGLISRPDDVVRPLPQASAPAPVKVAASAPAPAAVLAEPAPAPVAIAEPEPAPAAAPEPEPEPQMVRYTLSIRPSGTVYVDGKKRGSTARLKTIELAEGTHKIKVVNRGFPDYVTTVKVVAGQPGTIEHHFAASTLF